MSRRLWGHAQEPKSFLLHCALCATLTTFIVGGFYATRLNAQTSTPAPVPDWQTAAGGHMEFDVASVKQDNSGSSEQTMHSNIPLGPQEAFTPTGGLFSATNIPLLQYIFFAYKLTPAQVQSVMSQVPKWANTNRYDIEAKASGNPTKDQFRLMIQSLLADRFKLAVHFETKQGPIFNLVLDKPGKLGPQLQVHPADASCSTTDAVFGRGPAAAIAGGFPEPCGVVVPLSSKTSGRFRAGARDVPLPMIATFLNIPQLTGIDRPVVDKTGIAGNIDFVIEFSPELPAGVPFQADPNGPTFLEAIKDQLGLKLEPATGSIESIAIDHIEQPSEN
jgi:uncharacterized protein (TIGR03435 family)